MVKLQYASGPDATGIARGQHQEVSLMRPDRSMSTGSVRLACEGCAGEFGAYPSQAKKGRRFCSVACYQSRNHQDAPPLSDDGLTAHLALRSRDGSVQAYTIVDVADADVLGHLSWHLDNGGYAQTTVPSEQSPSGQYSVRMHRLILGLRHGDGLDGDHVNREKLDNRRGNLRIVTRGDNTQNCGSRRNSSSSHRGVSWAGERKGWAAYVRVAGTLKHLGYFRDEMAAADAARAGRALWLPFSEEFASSRQDADPMTPRNTVNRQPVAAGASDDPDDSLPF